MPCSSSMAWKCRLIRVSTSLSQKSSGRCGDATPSALSPSLAGAPRRGHRSMTSSTARRGVMGSGRPDCGQPSRSTTCGDAVPPRISSRNRSRVLADLQRLGERAAGQAHRGGPQQHRAQRLPGPKLGELIIRCRAEDQERGLVGGGADGNFDLPEGKVATPIPGATGLVRAGSRSVCRRR